MRTLRWLMVGVVGGVLLGELRQAVAPEAHFWVFPVVLAVGGLVDLVLWVRRKDPGAKIIDRARRP